MLRWFQPRRKTPVLLPGDYRHAPRHEGREHLQAAVGTSRWPAVVRDISTTGIGLVLCQRYQEGTCLPVRLLDQRSNTVWPMLARVVYATRLSDGYWFTGCSFEAQFLEPELEKLL